MRHSTLAMVTDHTYRGHMQLRGDYTPMIVSLVAEITVRRGEAAISLAFRDEPLILPTTDIRVAVAIEAIETGHPVAVLPGGSLRILPFDHPHIRDGAKYGCPHTPGAAGGGANREGCWGLAPAR